MKKKFVFIFVIVGVLIYFLTLNNKSDNLDVYIGQLTIGHEVYSFSECGSGIYYWFETNQNLQKKIANTYEKETLGMEPYTPILVEIVGSTSDYDGDGFAANYDGIITISDLKKTYGVESCESF